MEALPVEHQGWLTTLEKFDAERLDEGVRVVETGKLLAAIRDSGTFKFLNCHNLDEFYDAYQGITARHGRRFTAVAAVFTVEQLRGRVHTLATLTAIMGGKDKDRDYKEYRDALVEQGSGYSASKIASALRWAEMCESVPLGLAVIAYLLADGPRPPEMDELEERERAERRFAQLQRSLKEVVEGVPELGQMLADPDLAAARRLLLVTLCGGVAEGMDWLGFVQRGHSTARAEPAQQAADAAAAEPPAQGGDAKAAEPPAQRTAAAEPPAAAKPAAPRAQTVRVSPDGSVSPAQAGGSAAVRPEHGAPESNQPAGAAAAGGPVRPAGERRSPDRVAAVETSAQRDRRLCAAYQSVPFIEPTFELEVPPDWPEDWEQRWLETPAGTDPILLCADGPSPQRGTLGRTILGSFRLSLNLNRSFCCLIISIPGGGKTYTGNVITHMAVASLPNISEVPSPLCVVMPHYHADDSHEPELLAMRFANRSQREVSYLVEEVGSLPAGHADIVAVCFVERVEGMRQRYPHVQVYPLLFASSELITSDIEAMLGLDEPNDDRLYVRQLRQALRGALLGSLDELEQRLLSIEGLMPEGRRLVQARFALFRPMICDEYPLSRLPRSGRVIIVDGRDPTRSKDDALTMLHVAVSVLMRRGEGQEFNRLLRVDELSEFAKHKGFMGSVLMRSRKRRHLGDSLVCSTQFGHLVPDELVANSDLVLLGRTQSAEALRYLSRIKVQFCEVTAEQASALNDGEMLAWCEKVYVDPPAAAEVGVLPAIVEIQVRSQNAHHGGATRCAVPVPEGDEGEGGGGATEG